MGTWRKAYGSLKDSTRVGLAKVNSEFKELDIAIVKATNHVECPPKERRVRRIFTATSAVRPRADIAYCIFALAKRLSKTHNWVVAIKTLIVIHRLLREGDPTFKEELLNYSQNGILQISNFKDDSSPLAWECSTFARAYALFLEEKLQCFRVLKYDIEAEHLLKNASGDLKGRSKTRTLCCSDLLEQMPPLQQLLHRLSGCRPDGSAFGNLLIQHALILVLKESFKIYCAINDGIINLVEMFFEMRKYDAMKALEIYKRASQQAESLTDFYDFCKHLYLDRKFLFPTLKQLPSSFISTMEEYILEEAPYTKSFANKNLVHQAENLLTYKNNEHINAKVNVELPTEEKEERALAKFTEPLQTIPKVKPPVETTPDLLSIEDMISIAEEIEQKNALSLAVIEPAWDDSRTTSTDLLSGGLGWELALVTTPSNNASNVIEGKLAGGFDKLLLDSLYEDASSKGQQIVGGSSNANSFESGYPLVMPGGIGFSSNIQMNLMAQHQQQQYYFHHGQYQQHEQLQLYHQQQQMMMLQPYGYQTQNDLLQFGQTNPFSLPSNEHWQNDPPQGNSSLI